MRSILDLMGQQWSKDYNCFSLAQEAWNFLGKEGSILEAREKIEKPENPCIVYLSNSERDDSHVGIYVDGRVLHLGLRGAQYIPLELLEMSFKYVSFYK